MLLFCGHGHLSLIISATIQAVLADSRNLIGGLRSANCRVMHLTFASDFKDETDGLPRYRLLELNHDALLKAEELTIKGGDEDDVYICTESMTFRVREVNTSNLSLLTLPTPDTDNQHASIIAMTKTYLEPTKTAGRIDQLRTLLEAAPYDGPLSSRIPAPEALACLHCSRIFDLVQASDDEIRAALNRLDAVLLDGHYRLMSPDYLCRFFKSLFASISLLEMASGDILNMESLLESFDEEEFPRNVASSILHAFSSAASESSNEIRLGEEKICRFFAVELLKAKTNWTLGQLLIAWKKLTGDFEPRLDYLSGLAIFDPLPGSHDQRVTYIPLASLPLDLPTRLTKLFEIRHKWELTQLQSFFGDLPDGPAVMMERLVKLARISTDEHNVKYVTPLVSSAS